MIGPLGDIPTDRFLAQYWQQKPLLLRQAIPGFVDPMEADELAGLACEADVESRIVTGNAARQDWRLRHGPFDDTEFAALGRRDWTLLVQAVDHYVPGVAALRSLFRFVPDWRLDDVMVSFAAAGGSVGPHFDRYDVFLLQGRGQREWQVGERCQPDAALQDHADLQLLASFEARQRWTLQAGDMLYLPPGFAHWGIATEPCMTYSIGFRAPSHREIISHFCDHLVDRMSETPRFADRALDAGANPGLIGPDVIRQLSGIVSELMDERQLATWFGRYMTEPKYPLDHDAGDAGADALPPLSVALKLQLADNSRSAYAEQAGELLLFVDGRSFAGQGPLWRSFVETLCADRGIALPEDSPWRDCEAVMTVVQRLLLDGALFRLPR